MKKSRMLRYVLAAAIAAMAIYAKEPTSGR